MSVEKNITTLADMATQSRCVIVKINGHGGFRHRVSELGFECGKVVEVVKNESTSDSIEYQIMGSKIVLRRSEAANIEVVSFDENAHPDNIKNSDIEEHVTNEANELAHEITIALVGNYKDFSPEKIANLCYRNYSIKVIDLSDTQKLAEQHFDVVLNSVDATNLEHDLFLTTQLIDQNPRMVMALNKFNELEKTGDKLDVESLQRMLGFPIVVNSNTNDNVLDAIIDIYEGKNATKHIHINYGDNVEKAIGEIKTLLYENNEVPNKYHGRYIALKLLENDSKIHEEISQLANYKEIKSAASKYRIELENEYHNDISTIIADIKCGFIRGALNETLEHSKNAKINLIHALDVVLTNRWLGFPILLLFMWIMFEATFTFGAYPQKWLEMGVEALSNWIAQVLPAGILNDLIVDGIISGVGGVIVFLPNILIMFLFISLLEDTGYMARTAFLMDKAMHHIGLHGKSFIPYVIGFGCNVPAIMATKTLENRKDRILTILTIPFMSCSARLPVYLLFVAAFFAHYQGIILMSIYLIGVLFAIITALLINKIAFKNETDQFVMELPPFRVPTLRNMLAHMWDKSAQYLKKIGSVILVASIIIWALGYFPHPTEPTSRQETLSNSYIGQIGHAIEPVIKPLGFDWKMGVSLITGLAAKEIIVSSLGVLYSGNDADNVSLIANLQAQTDELGEPFFTPLKAFTFMLFILLYFPCIATISAIRRETGRKWMWFTIFYSTGCAWLISFIVYQIGSLF